MNPNQNDLKSNSLFPSNLNENGNIESEKNEKEKESAKEEENSQPTNLTLKNDILEKLRETDYDDENENDDEIFINTFNAIKKHTEFNNYENFYSRGLNNQVE